MSGFFKRYQRAIIWFVVISFFVGGVALVSLNQAGVFDQPSGSESNTLNIALVNGEPILTEAAGQAATTLLNQYQAYYQQLGESVSELTAGAQGALFLLDLRAQGLQTVIQQALLSQAATERKIQVSRDDTNQQFAAQYNEILDMYELTEADLEQILLQQGQTLAAFKNSLRSDVERQLREASLREQVVGVINPTDDELAGYLEANIRQYDSPERVRASHILVSDSELADDLHQRLLDGEDFAVLAREYSIDTGTSSNGGDLDWFERGDMVPEFEEAAFDLEVGQISKPIESQYGYHIILLTDRQAAFVPALNDIKDQVRDDYIADQEQERFASWYEAYYDASDIEILQPLLNAYMMQNEDLDASIAEYERLLAAKEISDPYFEYYIGRAYESRAVKLAGERAPLEDVTEPTEADLARIEELKALGKADENQALEHYLNALNALRNDSIQVDDAFINRVLLLEPTSTDARFLLGALYADRGDMASAEQQYDEIIQDSPNYIRAYIASGDLAFGLGQTTKAIVRFEAALALNPADTSTQASLYLRLAKAYLEDRKLDESASYLQKTEELDPGNAEILIVRGDLASAELKASIDQRVALEAIEQRTSEQDLELAAVQARVADLASEATGYYKTAIEQLGTLLDLQQKLGQVYLLAGNLDAAKSEFRSILVRSPYRVSAYEGLAEVLIAQGDVAAGLENLYAGFSRSFDDVERERIAARILAFAPDDVTTRLQYAALLSRQYKWSSAIREYGMVIAAEPTQVDAYLGIAEAYQWRTDYATAVEYLRRGLGFAAYDSQKESLYLALIETIQASVGAFQPLPAEGLDVRIDLAKLYLAQGRASSALTQLELVQSADPGYRLDEVNALIVQAGGTVVLPVDTSEDDAAPDSSSTEANDE
jgi:parvulin-like peptidyl-prolyl isomerase/Tfp pilus assembly protein PilF